MSDEEYQDYLDRAGRRTALRVCKKWYDVFWNNQTNVIVYASTMSVHASLAKATFVELVPDSDSIQEPLKELHWPNVTKIYIRYTGNNTSVLATLFDQIAEFVRVKDLSATDIFMQLITHPLPHLESLQLVEGIDQRTEPLDWLYRFGSTLTSLTFVETDFQYQTNVHIDLQRLPKLQQFDTRSVECTPTTTPHELRLRILALVEAAPQLTKVIVYPECGRLHSWKDGDETIAFGRALFEVSNRARCAFLSATFHTDDELPERIYHNIDNASMTGFMPESLLLWILEQPQSLKEFLLPRVSMAHLSPFVRALWRAKDTIVSAMISHAVKHGFIDELIAWVPVGVSRRSMLAYATDQSARYQKRKERIYRICELLVQYGSSLSDLDDCGYAPIHAAVARRQMRMVHLLVGLGADIHQPPAPQHGTILHIASKFNAMALQHNRRYFDWAKRVDDSMHRADGDGIRAITHFFHRDSNAKDGWSHTCVVDPNTRDSWGRTPLHYAAWAWEPRHWSFDIGVKLDKPAKMLVEAGADIHARDVFGCTPIHYATNVANVLECLNELGGDVFA